MSEQTHDKLQVLIAEYNALRAEILQWGSKQNVLLSANVTVGAGIIGLYAQASGIGNAWVLFSLVFSAFGLLWYDVDRNIHEVAHYLNNHLRPRMGTLLCDQQILEWEDHIRGKKAIKLPFALRSLQELCFITPAALCLFFPLFPKFRKSSYPWLVLLEGLTFLVLLYLTYLLSDNGYRDVNSSRKGQ